MIPIWQGPPAGDTARLAAILDSGAALLAEDLTVAVADRLAPAFDVDTSWAQTEPLVQDSSNTTINARADTGGSRLRGNDSHEKMKSERVLIAAEVRPFDPVEPLTP